MTRDMVLAIEVHEEPKTVFDIVATRSGLASFWTSDVEGDEAVGSELSFGFAHAPSRLPMRVSRLDATTAIEWESTGDWPFWEGTKISWSFEPSEHGTKVVLRHLGYDGEMPEYDLGSVALTWALVLARLKEVVESGGQPNPALG